MKRKIYININIPERDKKRLISAVSDWQDLPIKWTKEPNFHITLAYLGHVTDEEIVEVCEKVRAAVSGKEIFDLHFSDVELNSKTDARIVWLAGEDSQELLKLQEGIEKGLEIFVSERKTFVPHITLGRIRKKKWEELDLKPEIKKEINFAVTIESVEVMASDFENEGEEYSIVESCQLDG